MDLVFSPEQEELRRSLRRFLDERSPISAVRALMDDPLGYDPSVWRQMASQLGLQGLAIPEEYGGSGFGYVELTLVLEEMGRALLPGPFFATAVLAAGAILDAGDTEAAKELLPGIANGTTLATLAVTEDDGRWDLESVSTTATDTGGGWRLTGFKSFVPDGHVADLVLVPARTPSGLTLFAVDCTDARSAGASLGAAADATARRTPLPTLDQTRKLARLELADAPARPIGTVGEAARPLARTLDKAAVALAAEQLGGAQRTLDMAVDYAKVRTQFGRPIGSFQAVKHKAADMLMRVESARAAVQYAAWAVADDSDELPVVASLAKAYCSDAYFFTASENIQIHGGIGFTWEHDAHLHFKRAQSSRLFLGDGEYHRALLADRIGI
ncbi:acyl-CoA dehydrogenase family protein [Pseudonocardia acaciae]|uniref:acyl-CoA dehydrogenase family protein n=1 Tax=Pseudonocardia acaciae TaxID=551276 RepID=UPI00048D26C6|nr:acyl-CoA dehydrogenase family protein [Pseudonocardia acaciae]